MSNVVKEKKSNLLFDFLNAVLQDKTDYMRDEDGEIDQENAKSYSQHFINNGLSQYVDTILYANEMNCMGLSDDMHFRYLINTIRPAKRRRTKWAKKKEADEIVEMVREYFQCNRTIAKQYMKVLTNEQIKTIKEKMQKGVKNNGRVNK